MKQLVVRALFVIFAACSLSLLALISLAIFVRQDISHPESMVQWAVREVASGKALYPDFRDWPHRLMPYGPLLCYPMGVALRTLGEVDFGFHIYLAGRLQSVLYLLGTLLLCSRVLVSAGYGQKWGIAFSGAYLALWSGIMVPAVSFRADFPGLFWALTAAYVAFRDDKITVRSYVALIPFMLSVAYKPSFWAFPAAFCLLYWSLGGFKRPFIWGASLVTLVLIYIGAAQVLTGQLFLLNQVQGSSLGVTSQLFVICRDLLLNPVGFPLLTWDLCARLLLAVGAAVWLLRSHSVPLAKGIALYFLIALPVNILTFFKVGAGLNYGLEAYVLSGLVLGISGLEVYGRLPLMKKPALAAWVSMFVLLIVLPAGFFTWVNFKGAYQTFGNLEGFASQKSLMKLPPTALLGDQAFTHPSESTHALSDPVPFAQLSVKDVIPKKPLTERIRRREFSHFVMSAGMKYLFFSPEKALWVGNLLEEYYVAETIVPEYEIWVPKDSVARLTTDTLVTSGSTE